MAGLELKYFNGPLHNIYLVGEVSEEMYANLTKKIDEIREDDEAVIINNFSVLQSVGIDVTIGRPKIDVYITTYGGNVYDMFAIYDALKKLQKDYVVNIYAQGKVISAGTVIFLAVDKKHRFAGENTTFMFHDLSGGAFGKVKELEENAEEGKRLHSMIWQIFKDNTKMPEKLLTEMYENKKDIYLNARQAKKFGIIEEIV